MALVRLLGETVEGKNGQAVPVADLQNADTVVGLYFSAHWCPPCRGFTPKLTECYNALKQKNASTGKRFEVIFLSSDRDLESFQGYYDEMPWLTIGFGKEKKQELADKYGVKGIPCLVLLKGEDASEMTRDGRTVVMNDVTGSKFPWE